MATLYYYDPSRGLKFTKVICPICNKPFDEWYCPICGLPKFNSRYIYSHIYSPKLGMYHNQDYRFRPELKSYEDFQLCSKCGATNPYGAKYCRCCKAKMNSQAIDKNGHGWVDLGLSVLWSTEEVAGTYAWMRAWEFVDGGVTMNDYDKKEEKDSAADAWGEKWRMPTREEVEELIERCAWEKVVIDYIPNSLGAVSGRYNVNAFKVTGPNGNSIFIPTSQHCKNHHGGINKNMICMFWTSTQATGRDTCAYRFFYRIYGDNCTSESEKNALWLSTPFDKNDFFKNNRHPYTPKSFCNPIRPVADKKWQGHI